MKALGSGISFWVGGVETKLEDLYLAETRWSIFTMYWPAIALYALVGRE